MVVLALVALAAVSCAFAAVSLALSRRVRGLRVELAAGREQSQTIARADALTQLPNRLALEERLPGILDGARERGESVAVMFVDIDRFKTINDTLGHRTGDMLLRAVSARFVQRMQASSAVFRTGGDEFVIVVDRIRHKRTIASAAMDVLETFKEPFFIDGRELFVTASVGASTFPKNAQTAGELIAFADSAMYRAKDTGRNNAKFYDRSMHARVLERMSLEQDLRQALVRGELKLLYQPVIEMATGATVAAEALLRWDHPTLGILSPQAFITIAEETGAITDISRWVLREACARAVSLRQTVPEFRIAVNLSPRDFYEDDLPQVISAVLAEAGLPPAALDVEVTETIVMSPHAVGVLGRVHALGVRIVMDDFGVGYSSLAYVKRLPVDALKIDKVFVNDITRDAFDQGIVKAIATLSKTLGLRLIAEGVENEAQRQFLRALDCDLAQGFLFAHPGSWEQIVVLAGTPQTRAERRVIPLYGTP